jgi:hypothetical protein
MSVSGVSSAPPYTPVQSQVKPVPVNLQAAAPTVQPVAKDSDGDNDGSTGGTIDTHA